MDKLIVDVSVDENHIATIKLPDVLPGNVRLEIRVLQNTPPEAPDSNNREWLLAKLKAAGLFVEGVDAEPEAPELLGYEVMSDEEEEAFGVSLGGPRPMEDYVYEDREERF